MDDDKYLHPSQPHFGITTSLVTGLLTIVVQMDGQWQVPYRGDVYEVEYLQSIFTKKLLHHMISVQKWLVSLTQ